VSAAAGKPGTKREAGEGAAETAAEAADEDDSSTAPNKRSKARQQEDADMTDAGLQAAAAAAAAAGDRPHYTDEHTVFVKGLGFDVQEEDLKRLFAELGVKSVRMGRDRVTGASRVSAKA
jgi:RNA recognition motif-containing protein